MTTSSAPFEFAAAQLKSFVERVERLHEERENLSDDIRDIYAEANGNGFDVKALKEIIRLRKQDPNEVAEHDAIVETYLAALGMTRSGAPGSTESEPANSDNP